MDERHDERRLGRDRRRHPGGEHLVWVSVSGVIALVLIAFVSVYGITRLNDVVGTVQAQQERADRQDRQLAALRNEQTRTACLQTNESVRRVRLTFANSVEVVRPPSPTPDMQARIEKFIATYTAAVNSTLRYRDCSPAGIRAYFENPPVPSPPEKCVPDGKGFCQ